MTEPLYRRVWGGATAFLVRSRRLGWPDLLVAALFLGLLWGMVDLGEEWSGALHPAVEIDLAPRALPRYAFFSLARGLFAYVISLGFTLGYGYWAAKDRVAERVLVPLLDILQSIPVLGFMPGLVLALVALFPRSNVGLELAAVLMIFTGQAWNMTFSFYHSLQSVPPDQREVSVAYRFSWWQRLRWVELPFATLGLVWNSMMSMAGGWFFLMISEAFVLGDKDFRLPGLGSYMSAAVAKGDTAAMAWAVATMVAMIVIVDQLLWRPVVVWAQKFRVEEAGAQEQATSWFLDFLGRSRAVALLARVARRLPRPRLPRRERRPRPDSPAKRSRASAAASALFFAGLVGALGLGSVRLMGLMRAEPLAEWGQAALATFATLARVLAATALGTLWALPAGLAIGLSPRLARLLQPLVQVVASFPAPMLFPAVVAVLKAAGVGISAGSVVLMLLGTQWYILFNVIAGAMAIPAELREAAEAYRLTGWRRFRRVLLPAVFPYLVTGWVTAAGGAWNASIVSEYVSFRGEVLSAFGVGSRISLMAQHADFPALAVSLVVMAATVVGFNRLVWRRLYRLASDRYSLAK